MIDAMPQETSDALIRAYDDKDYQIIKTLVTEEEMGNYRFEVGQTSLFETEDVPYGQK